VRFKVLLTSGAPIGSKPISRWWLNQSGDALCYVSPARCAVSSLTYAKRITRPIFSERFGTLAGGESTVACAGYGPNGCELLTAKILTQSLCRV